MVDTLVANATSDNDEALAQLYQSWGERMLIIRDWCVMQVQEMTIFGEVFDSDQPFELKADTDESEEETT